MATILTRSAAATGTHSFALSPGAAMLRMIAVARQRRQLTTLDDAQLTDLGLTREMAEAEASRPFWDLDGVPGDR